MHGVQLDTQVARHKGCKLNKVDILLAHSMKQDSSITHIQSKSASGMQNEHNLLVNHYSFTQRELS